VKNHKGKLKSCFSKYDEFKKLGSYLKNVYLGSVPNNIFNSSYNARVSQFKIRGLKSTFLKSFSKQLIREGKILKYDNDSKLPKFAQKVFETYYKNHLNKKPGHEPILKNILIKDEDSIAIEVPIWSKIKERTITGHIDLVQIENNTIKIIDYKPEGKFLFSLPQVAMYGLLIKKILHISDLNCITFNKNLVWEYKPEILLTDVSEILKSSGISQKWENFF
jgi:hypothetical protein